MLFFKKIFSKKRYSDGSALWPSGKEKFTYQDQNGMSFDFDVFFEKTGGKITNTIVGNSLSASNGQFVTADVKRVIFAKSKLYFAERGELCWVL